MSIYQKLAFFGTGRENKILPVGSRAAYFPSFAIPRVSRETLRCAALRCSTPFLAPRTSAGSAAAIAASAPARSPAEMASSTLRRAVRTRDRRDLLIAVRRAI
jgi:hypothetical protein